MNKGTSHYNSKLTEEQVLEIRKLYDAGERPVIIAESYPVSAAMVSQIGRRIAWKHLP